MSLIANEGKTKIYGGLKKAFQLTDIPGVRYCEHRRKWTALDDEFLTQRYNRFGPAWTVIGFAFANRTSEDCRRRWLRVGHDRAYPEGTASFTQLPEYVQKIYTSGFEKYNNADKWIKIPEPQVKGLPITKIASALPEIRIKERKNKDWSELEHLVIREAYESLGPQWNLIASKLKARRRTPNECKNFMQNKFVSQIKFD